MDRAAPRHAQARRAAKPHHPQETIARETFPYHETRKRAYRFYASRKSAERRHREPKPEMGAAAQKWTDGESPLRSAFSSRQNDGIMNQRGHSSLVRRSAERQHWETESARGTTAQKWTDGESPHRSTFQVGRTLACRVKVSEKGPGAHNRRVPRPSVLRTRG